MSHLMIRWTLVAGASNRKTISQPAKLRREMGAYLAIKSRSPKDLAYWALGHASPKKVVAYSRHPKTLAREMQKVLQEERAERSRLLSFWDCPSGAKTER